MSKPKKPIYVRLLRGQVVSSDFFARHWLGTLVVLLVIMIYITTKYKCQTNMERIDALTANLEVVENELAREHAHYMGATRETQMQQLVDSLDLGLRVQSQPPYRIQ